MALLLSRLRSYNGFLPLYFNYWKISFTQNIEILCVLKDGFVNNTTLNNHVKAKHSDEKPYVCEHCPARYATSMSLSTHRSRVHRVNKAGNFWPLDQLSNYYRVWYFVSKFFSQLVAVVEKNFWKFRAEFEITRTIYSNYGQNNC